MKHAALDKQKNKDQYQLLLSKLKFRLEKIHEGGGLKKIEKQHKKGKLSVRERIEHLLDKNSDFLEVGAFAAYDMYKEHGGCPAAGVVTGIGYVSGRQCMIIANDAMPTESFI